MEDKCVDALVNEFCVEKKTLEHEKEKEEEFEKYRKYYAEKHNTDPSNIVIEKILYNEDGTVDVFYKNLAEVKVERIRRICGYLSCLDNWNDGKRAEEKDRVKHI